MVQRKFSDNEIRSRLGLKLATPGLDTTEGTMNEADAEDSAFILGGSLLAALFLL